jgi:hypothetical protein
VRWTLLAVRQLLECCASFRFAEGGRSLGEGVFNLVEVALPAGGVFGFSG